jgi:mRNA-degrading endonuclease RelE of RelBE toxin-antitoxin system
MRKMPAKRRQKLAEVFEEVAALPDVTTHPRVSELSGKHKGSYRIRVGQYRAIFCLQAIEERGGEMYVDWVGPRGGAY